MLQWENRVESDSPVSTHRKEVLFYRYFCFASKVVCISSIQMEAESRNCVLYVSTCFEIVCWRIVYHHDIHFSSKKVVKKEMDSVKKFNRWWNTGQSHSKEKISTTWLKIILPSRGNVTISNASLWSNCTLTVQLKLILHLEDESFLRK